MTACKLGFGTDVGACLHSLAVGWVPDWLWPLLPYWPWTAVLIGAGVAWRFAGTPGLVAFAGAVGFVLGRRSVGEQVPGKVAPSKVAAAPKPAPLQPKKRQTIFSSR